MTEQIHKYPRTPHLAGSRLQPGDEDLAQVPLEALRGQFVVVEEKLDGANAGIALDPEGALRLQSRGHALTGGARERHFNLFKQWAGVHQAALAQLVAGSRTLYGEWLYAKHTIFYDRLPHYFLEFDVRDPDGSFWSTARRRALLAGTPVRSVPVIWEGVLDDPRTLPGRVAPSLYKSARWRDALVAAATAASVDPERARHETDPADLAEGLYLKVEADGVVVARYKWVRASFLTSVLDSGSHWLTRPIIPNQLASEVDLFSPGARR
ncbi:MAG: RNA ligase family protein [Kofleriaceae bacterium]